MNEERDREFYTPAERDALRSLAAEARPDGDMEDRLVGILQRRGLIETPDAARGPSRLRSMLLGLVKPALVGAAVAGAFVLGRVVDGDRMGRLVQIPAEGLSVRGVGGDPVHPARESIADGVPRALFVAGDEDRRYEYYVDDEGQNYYVLVKLPMPRPLSTSEADHHATHAPRTVATARTVPSIEDSRFEYFYDTHGNAYGVLVKDAPATDLFATR
jgi:hypothetical protein